MKKTLGQAKNYAFRLLNFRLRSKREVKNKLKSKDFPTHIIKEVLDFLVDLRYVDDLNFAQLWVSSRLRTKPRSKRFLRYELLKKGVNKEIIETVLAPIDSAQEITIAREAAENKMRTLKKLDKAVIKRRLFGYLQRRGFSAQITIQIAKELLEKMENHEK
ncbi:MAG: regulatory protein RecX [PVC group bacterium]|nr:regulatory protein RecX [PVC group bacterium]